MKSETSNDRKMPRKQGPARFALILTAPAGEPREESDRQFRSAFKAIRRSHGIKCLAIREVKSDQSNTHQQREGQMMAEQPDEDLYGIDPAFAKQIEAESQASIAELEANLPCEKELFAELDQLTANYTFEGVEI